VFQQRGDPTAGVQVPAGRLDAGESLHDALARELDEETGVRARIVRAPNTLHLEDVWVSEPLVRELEGRPHIASVESPEPMRFDDGGRLC